MNKSSLLLLATALPFLSGCAVNDPATDSELTKPKGTISVKLITPPETSGALSATVYTMAPDGRPGQTVTEHAVGADRTISVLGSMDRTYGVRAYLDANGNGKQDTEELSGKVNALKPVAGAVVPVELVLAKQAAAEVSPLAGAIEMVRPYIPQRARKQVDDSVRKVAPNLPAQTAAPLPVPPPPAAGN